jgi:uncharacterized protein YjlB
MLNFKFDLDFMIKTYFFENDGTIPNSYLPVIFYSNICESVDCAVWFEAKFKENNWTNNWRDIVLPYDHFHSNTHEVLAVSKGTVKLKIGGENGIIIEAAKGDVIILPAGVGHYSASEHSDYQIVGGYPNGLVWDMCTDLKLQAEQILQNIKAVKLPETDPIFGKKGPVLEFWH